MSLTSYRAAPPRDAVEGGETSEWVFVFAGCNAWRRPTLPLLEQ